VRNENDAIQGPARVCLVLMFKAPDRSKRRLAGEIGPLAAAAAARLCDCALEDLADWPGAVCYAPAHAADRAWLETRVPPGPSPVLLQRGRNLGARINDVAGQLRGRGFERQIFIGIDCPGLDQGYLRQAANRLLTHDAVLGPAADGGVVLLGARRPWPELDALPWSTGALRERLGALCRAAGWSVATLPAREDVDDLSDLRAARRSLAGDERPARRALCDWLQATIGD
jgi:glycosyltransferase A (GT-A) superfamily protein (DUF2064 family)